MVTGEVHEAREPGGGLVVSGYIHELASRPDHIGGGPKQRGPRVAANRLAFSQALAGLGWTIGRNVRIDLRRAGGEANRMRALAQELVGLQPDIILTNSTPAAVAIQRETRTIPSFCGRGRSCRQRLRR